MKSIILTVTFLGIYFHSFSYYKREAINGGPHGYYTTSVVKNGDNWTEISCKDPGYSECPMFPEDPSQDEGALVNIIMSRIYEGQLTGRISYRSLVGEWIATDNTARTSTILIR